MSTIILHGYVPHKFSGKQNYIKYLFHNKKYKNLYHDWNIFNYIYPKFTYLFRSYDVVLLYSLKVFLYIIVEKILHPKKRVDVVINSQENIFLVDALLLLKVDSIEIIFYDFAAKDSNISFKDQKRLRKANKICVMTNSMLKELKEKIPTISRDNIFVKHYKVRKDDFYLIGKEERLEGKRRAKLPEKYILYVGSEQDRKNLFTIIKAFRKLLDVYPDLFMVKIGKDQCRNNRKELQKMLKGDSVLAKRFLLVEDCSVDELRFYYNYAIVFVFPSLYEGFGIPLLEAMACGLPIVATGIETTKEICGKASVYIDDYKNVGSFVNAISGIIDSRGRRDDLSKLGLSRVKEFIY